jgi:hypothetical protein
MSCTQLPKSNPYYLLDRCKEQLTAANHTVERLVSEAANTPALLRQLSVARQALEKLLTAHHPNYGVCHEIARKALTEMEE